MVSAGAIRLWSFAAACAVASMHAAVSVEAAPSAPAPAAPPSSPAVASWPSAPPSAGSAAPPPSPAAAPSTRPVAPLPPQPVTASPPPPAASVTPASALPGSPPPGGPAPMPVVLSESRPEDPDRDKGPRLHHAAPAIAAPHVALVLSAVIELPHLIGRAIVVYRPLPAAGHGSAEPVEWREVTFLRGTPGPYVAAIPPDAVRSPGLDYAIELEHLDGRREAVFASRFVPQRVSIFEDPMDVRERVALERLGGNRSLVSASFEYIAFNTHEGAAADNFYRTEAAYTYRMLRTVDEFGVHVGVARGHSPGNDDTVGLNYASSWIRFRVADLFRIEGELLASVTEVGFAGGGGAAFDIGDPYGTKLRVGFEGVNAFGFRWYSQVDVPIVPRLRLSPIVEATNMPHALRYGIRLVGEIAYDFGGGVSAALRGGYQARESTAGGPSGGAQLMFAF